MTVMILYVRFTEKLTISKNDRFTFLDVIF